MLINDLSGSVARQLSGRHTAPKGVGDETNGPARGDPEDEIRIEVYEGWNEGRLTQAEAGQILGMREHGFRRYCSR